MNENIVIIFCLPLSQYPVQPTDISKAEPVPCPDCNQMMWLSEKKKSWKSICEMMRKEIIFCCGDCLKTRLIKMKENGELDNLDEFNQIKI